MSSPSSTRSRLGLLLLAVFAMALSLAPAARAVETASTAYEEAAPLRELPDLVLTPWLASQTRSGNFKRPSGNPLNDGYSNTGIAYAMLLESVRSGDEKYFNSAMRAIGWTLRTRRPMQGVFYQMFTAAAYNVARQNFSRRAAFRRISRSWAGALRGLRYQRGVFGSHYRYNKNLVEALEVIELYNSRLKTNARGAILRDRRDALRRAVRLMNVWIARRANDYTVAVGAAEGWPLATEITQMSDPPDNPPAYNALTAALFMRAYDRLPRRYRTARMRQTAERMIGGVIARTAPDGDIAFDGRSQEQAWALSSAAFAAWNAAGFEQGVMREIQLAFARRVVGRLERVHVTANSSFGFVLTPAAGCCDRQDMPPGQDHYYDVGDYSGLTALTMGWALERRPKDWQSGTTPLPTDSPSNLIYRMGRGRFFQHRGSGIYWFLRMQSDYYDARADMGVAVMKVRSADGSWRDVVPPRPYTGGHHRPADPGSPCLVYRRGCAFLELHGGVPDGVGGYQFEAVWRTARRTIVRRAKATVVPLARGLRISWAALPGDRFEVDNFLPKARCTAGGVGSPGLSVTISGQTGCRIDKAVFAGGARVDLLRSHSVVATQDTTVAMTYSASGS
jgi:hypothetical protein